MADSTSPSTSIENGATSVEPVPVPVPVPTSNLKDIALAAKAATSNVNKLTPEEIAQRQERQLSLLNSFAEYLAGVANSAATAASAKGYGWTKVAEYYLPGFIKTEDGNTVPRHAPQQTHWAGNDVDPSNGGVPIVMLLQGVREVTRAGPRLRPDFLAGGKTSLQIAQDKLTAPTRLDCSFNPKKKSLIVTAIWIEEDWADFQRRRQQRSVRNNRVPRQSDRYVAPTARK